MTHNEWELHQKLNMVNSLVALVEEMDKYPWQDTSLSTEDRGFIMNGLVMLGEELCRKLES